VIRRRARRRFSFASKYAYLPPFFQPGSLVNSLLGFAQFVTVTR
jgi:hypothetical protein